jgi:hypothetical protein
MTPEHDPIGSAPTPDEIRAEVDRMVVSVVFTRSPQLGAFLRFVVESVLRGKADRIKAYTIGIEVLRRDVKFDPQIDPIVRVEATRLRRAIERYYAGPGADDSVVIDLPRGSYVPTFRRRDDVAGAAVPNATWRERIAAIPHWAMGAVGLVLVAFAIGTGALLQNIGDPDKSARVDLSARSTTERRRRRCPAMACPPC